MDRGLEASCATTGKGAWQKGVGGGRRYKGLPLCNGSFYLLFEMVRRERGRKVKERMRERDTERENEGERNEGWWHGGWLTVVFNAAPCIQHYTRSLAFLFSAPANHPPPRRATRDSRRAATLERAG